MALGSDFNPSTGIIVTSIVALPVSIVALWWVSEAIYGLIPPKVIKHLK